jgi:adenylate cyclase
LVAEAAGWSVWWDPAIEPGQEFDRQIAAELANATAVLVVWTPTSVESRWVRGEARAAADDGKIVPARFDGATLPIDFRALHTIDIDRWDQDARNHAAHELLRAIGAAVGRQRAAKATPSAAPPHLRARSSIEYYPSQT